MAAGPAGGPLARAEVVMSRRRNWATLGLVALLLVDIALVFLALRNPFHPQAQAPAPSATAGSPGATGSPSSASPTTGGSSAGPGSATATAKLGLVPFDTDSALRFGRGDCQTGGATVELTTNGGKTWRAVESPLRTISAASVTDDNRFQFIGGTDACQTATRRTADGGQTWAAAGNWSGWYRSPGNPVQVVTAVDRTVTPCATAAVVDVQSVSQTTAHVLCATSKLLETADGGTNWVDASKALEVMAVDDNQVNGKAVATIAYRTDSCPGLQIGTLTGATLAKLGCAELGSATPELGSVAVAARGPQVWLLVGTGVWLSGDGGTTWAAAG